MRRAILVGLTVALLTLLLPATALAATAINQLHVQIWPEEQAGSTLLLVSAVYPANMKLPQPVKLALPKGAQVQWAGEVFGGKDAAKDLEARYKLNPKKDYDEITFTLTKARIAQVEASIAPVTSDGTKRSLSLNWVQAYPSGTVDFAFKTPAGSTGAYMNPPVAYQDKDSDGLQYYGSGPMSIPVGKTQQVTISYNQGAAGGSAASNSNLTLGILVLVIGGGGIGLVLYNQARKGRR